MDKETIKWIMTIARPAIVATYGRQPLKLVQYRDRLAYQGKSGLDIYVHIQGRDSEFEVTIERGAVTGIKRTPQIITDIIKETELDVLVRWYFTLNSWGWPDDMPGKPENWDDLQRSPNINVPPGTLTRTDIIRPMMALIKFLVGEKKLKRLVRERAA